MVVVKEACWERSRLHLIVVHVSVSICILTTKRIITWYQIQFCQMGFLRYLRSRYSRLKHHVEVQNPQTIFCKV